MTRTVGIGAIGCGGMGRAVLKAVLEQDKRPRLAAFYDPDERAVKATLDMSPGPPWCARAIGRWSAGRMWTG